MRKIVLIISLLFVFSFGKNVLAYSSEICDVNPSYSNPITGEIEDAGNSPEIGQSMTESVVYPQGLVEENNGKYYLSVRYNLADNIKNEKFYVQDLSGGAFNSVNFELVKSSKDTKDFRFEIPSKNIVVKASFYVEAMGRDIVFFYSLSNFIVGNTDFEPIENQEVAINNEESQKESEELTVHGESTIGENNSEKSMKDEKIKTKVAVEKLGYKHGLLMREDLDLKNILSKDENSEKENLKEESDNKEMGDWTKIIVNSLFTIIGVITSILLVVAYLSHIILKKIKYENEILMEDIYEE